MGIIIFLNWKIIPFIGFVDVRNTNIVKTETNAKK